MQRLVRSSARDAGFTIVELIVAIAVISVLMALIIPAVQSAREAARRTQCRNNVKQLALAMETHVAAHGRYPTNGWGFQWIGHPDRGTDRRQPGGWIYNILPHLEQGTLRELGRGEAPADQRESLSKLMQTPLPVLDCPSRPGEALSPAVALFPPYNAHWVPLVAKTDYAVNEGDYITDTRMGPPTLQEGDSPKYKWEDVSGATGICFLRSEIRPADIKDGLSNTYLLGEKYVSTAGYDTDQDSGHDQSMYSGVDLDINRWVLQVPLQDTEYSADRAFGSAHQQGCHMALCDGSVRLISYSIDAEVHRRLGNRKDGLPVAVP